MRPWQTLRRLFGGRPGRIGGLLAVIVSLEGTAAAAQQLTLDEAIRTGIANSLVIRQQDTQVSGAEARLKEAGGAFDWSVGAETGVQTLYVPGTRGGFLTDQTQTIYSPYYSANIGRVFRNGIEVRPGVTAYPGSGTTAGQTLGLTQLRPSLGLSIPILRGLGEESADANERSAAESAIAARFDRNFVTERVVHDVVQTFWRCIASDQHVQIADQSDQQATVYVTMLQLLAERGLIEPTLVQRVVAMNVGRHLAIDQARDAAQACHRDLGLVMGNLAGAPAPSPVGELPGIDAFGPAIDRLNQASLVDLAFEQRTDLRAIQRNIAAAGAASVGAEDAKRPVLSLLLDPQRTIVTYRQSLQNNAAEGHAAAAAATENGARLSLLQLQDRIRVEIAAALGNLRQSNSSWLAVKKSEQQMENVVADTERRAEAGLVDRSEVLAVRDQLTQLRNQLIDLRLQFAASLAALRLATGTVGPVDQAPAIITERFFSPPAR